MRTRLSWTLLGRRTFGWLTDLSESDIKGTTTPRLIIVVGRWPLLIFWIAMFCESPAWPMDLVKSGQPAATIVVPDKPLPVVTAAAEELQYHLRKASGAKLPIVKESAAPAQGGRVFLGATRTAAKEGLIATATTPNAFQIRLVGSKLFIVGDDSDGPVFGIQHNNRTRVGTLFGVYDFIQIRMDVRWLWPGELGEVIPPVREVAIEKWDQFGQPAFVHARWRDYACTEPAGWASPEARSKYLRNQSIWLRRHRFALGMDLDAAHAFTGWWDRFSKNHHEYFNLLPDGTRRPDPNHWGGAKTLVSMCVGEPALWRQIVADWQEKRFSQDKLYIDASENDTDGRCVCEKCLAMDEPDPDVEVPFDQRVAVARERFAKGDREWTAALGCLSDRYARYYLAVQQEAEKYEPHAVILAYAYANYAKLPRNTKLNDRIIIGIVPAFYFPWTDEVREAFRRQWDGWSATGARLWLRPNYMLDGHNLPIFFARKLGEDFSYAAARSMVGTDFDSLTGQWGTQGPNLYMLGRLHTRPDLAPERILDEYYAGFGSAGPAVRAYFAHWEMVSDAVTSETYNRGWKEKGIPDNPEHRFYRWAEQIFTPKVMRRGRELIDKARAAAATDELVQRRVDFLEKGLHNAELTLATQAAHEQWQRTGDRSVYDDLLARLVEYRKSVEGDGVANMGYLMNKESMTWDYRRYW